MVKLKDLRVKKNLSLRQLADLAGVQPGTLNRIELGTAKPHPATMAKICKALGVESLVGFQPQIQHTNETEYPDRDYLMQRIAYLEKQLDKALSALAGKLKGSLSKRSVSDRIGRKFGERVTGRVTLAPHRGV